MAEWVTEKKGLRGELMRFVFHAAQAGSQVASKNIELQLSKKS